MGNLKFVTLQLFREYEKSRSQEVRNQIVQLNIRLAKKEASNWIIRCGESYDDILQVASLGLLKAVERFDLAKGNAFSSFAISYIRGEIRHYLRDKTEIVRLPRRWEPLCLMSAQLIQKSQQAQEPPPSDQEIAKVLDISIQEWWEIKRAIENKQTLSLDLLLDQDDNGGQVSIADSLADPKYQSFQLAFEDQIRLQIALEQLEEKTRQILEFVFLYDLSQKETSQLMGLSALTISRHVKKGIKHLKDLLLTEIW